MLLLSIMKVKLAEAEITINPMKSWKREHIIPCCHDSAFIFDRLW